MVDFKAEDEIKFLREMLEMALESRRYWMDAAKTNYQLYQGCLDTIKKLKNEDKYVSEKTM